MKEKITAVIQARLGSTRLAGKTLMMLEGQTLLGHLVNRVRASKHIDGIVIATTVKERDDAIAEFAKGNGIDFSRGSEDDVLDRFYQAAVKYGLETIVRVTPDCPMLDPEVTDYVISQFVAGDYDYVSNVLTPTYPDGLDTEVFSFHALKRAWNEAKLPSEREHVTAYIHKHPELFRLFNVKRQGEDLSWMRWTVDTDKDLLFAREIFKRLGSKGIFHMDDVLRLLRDEPEILEINQGITRNEGYRKSLEKDKEASGGQRIS